MSKSIACSLRNLTLALTPVLFSSAVFAQENSDSSKSLVVSALKKLSENDVSLVGAIEEEEAEEESANGPGGAVVRQVFVKGFGNEKSFTGDLSVNVMKDKSLVLFSKDALPSIRIYKSQNDLLCNQVHKDEPIDPQKLTNQLATLCDWTNLATQVEAATKVRSSSKGTNQDIRVVLESTILDEAPEAPNPAPGLAQGVRIQFARNPIAPRVVDLTAVFTLNQSNELTGITYELQYDDPLKAMMANAMPAGGGVMRVQAAQIAPAAPAPAVPAAPAPVAPPAPAAPPKIEKAGNKPVDAPIPPKAGGPAIQAFQIGGANNQEPTLGKLIRMDFDISNKVPDEAKAFATEAKKLLAK